MYYRLDRDLADFLTFVFAQVRNGEVLVVFTSDHGTSPSFDTGHEESDRFNTRQFEVIVNGFLNVRYGMGDWVLEYEDKCVYLNHNLIYERGLDLAEVQNEVAIFAMQFRACRTPSRRRPCGRATSGAAMPARCRTASTPAVRATSS